MPITSCEVAPTSLWPNSLESLRQFIRDSVVMGWRMRRAKMDSPPVPFRGVNRKTLIQAGDSAAQLIMQLAKKTTAGLAGARND